LTIVFVDDADDNDAKCNQAKNPDNGKKFAYFGGAYEINGE
jgi:hypothetical protein